MQSFDAKPISPFPSGSGKTQKTGGGDGVGGSAGKKIVTLSQSPLRGLPRHPDPGLPSEVSEGGGRAGVKGGATGSS